MRYAHSCVLGRALASGADLVVLAEGDGTFNGADLLNLRIPAHVVTESWHQAFCGYNSCLSPENHFP